MQTRVASTTQAAGKKLAAKNKNSGKGIFKKCACSADLAAITGSKSMTRGQAVKAVWVSARLPSLVRDLEVIQGKFPKLINVDCVNS